MNGLSSASHSGALQMAGGGMTIVLRLRAAQREAILEFPMPSARRSKLQPQLRRPQVNQRIPENGVRATLAAGWEPLSRGKPVTFEVDADGCQWSACGRR